MRRGLGIIGGLAGLLLLAAWLVPPSLDASRYRGALEEIASEALGHRARIAGKLAFTLLPLPRLTATDVILGNEGGTILRAEELRLRVAPWPMLAGHFTAHDLVLRGADIRLPWPPRFGAPNSIPAQWATPFPTRVEQARLVLGGLEVRDIAADIRATESGFEIRGTAKARGHDWRLTARLGTPDIAGTTSFEISAEGTARQSNAMLRVDGRVTQQGDATARASIQSNDLSQWFPAPAIGLRASGQLHATADGLRAEDWAVSLPSGNARVDAKLGWQPATSLAIRLAMPRFDLDPWLPAIAGTRATALPITLDFAVEAANLGGRDLRQIRGRLAWGDTGIGLRDGTAILPGEATLALDGTVPDQAGGPWFIGHTRLAANDPRTTLAWMESLFGLKLPTLGGIPPHGMDIAARLELGAGTLSLGEMRGNVAGTDVSGALGLRQDGARTMVLADLELGQLRLGPWPDDLAVVFPALSRSLANLGGEVQARVVELRLGDKVAKNLILDAGLADGRLTLRRLAGNAFGARFDVNGGLAADGRITDARIDINTADALTLRGLLPARWQATSSLWEAPLNLRADVSGTIENLVARLQLELGDLRLDTQQSINASAGSGGYRLSAHHPGAQRLLTALGVADSALAGSLSAWAPDWPGEGSFSLQAQGSWREHALALDTFQLTAGGLRGEGQLNIGIPADQPVVTGKFHAEALPLPLPATNVDTPLPVRLAHAVQVNLQLSADDVRDGDKTLARQASCTLSVARAQASLETCTMQIGGGNARLDATLSATADLPRLTMTFSLDDARIGPVEDPPPVGIIDGSFTAHGSVRARGYSLATLRDTAAGDVGISLNGIVLAGMDLPGINAAMADARHQATTTTTDLLRSALMRGTTRFDSLTASANLADGILQLRNGSASGQAGSIGFGGSVDVRTGLLDAIMDVQPVEAPASGLEVRLSGRATAPERMPVLLRALRWLAEKTN